MNITIDNAEALQKTLSRMAKVITKKTVIPILNNLLVKSTHGALDFQATNLDLELQEAVPVANLLPNSSGVTIVAAMLHDIIRKAPKEVPVTFSTTDKGRITIHAGRSRFVLNTLPAEDYPTIAAGKLTSKFAIPQSSLMRLFDDTELAICTEAARYYLCGLFLKAGDSMLRAVATNGHQLAKAEVQIHNIPTADGVVVPQDTIEKIKSIIDRDANDTALVELSPQKIRVTCNGATLTSKLIDATYPDYERVIPMDNSIVVEADAEELLSVIERTAIVIDSMKRGCKFSFAPGTLTVCGESSDGGSSVTEEMDIVYDGQQLDIGFNPFLLAPILERIVETSPSKTAVWKLASDLTAGSPALILPKDDLVSLFVLMPMRV